MTTIAYRSGVMAGDTQVAYGNLRFGTTRKAWRLRDGSLFGFAGTGSLLIPTLRWVEEDLWDRKMRPVAKEDDSVSGLVVQPGGTILFFESDFSPYPVVAEFLAIGSGTDLAIGAMEMGASAESAVAIAMKHDMHTGGEIQTVHLGGS